MEFYLQQKNLVSEHKPSEHKPMDKNTMWQKLQTTPQTNIHYEFKKESPGTPY